MENQAILAALAHAIQELAAKTAASEAALQSLIRAQDASTRARFTAAFEQSAQRLLTPKTEQPLTDAATQQLTLAVNAYLETAADTPQ